MKNRKPIFMSIFCLINCAASVRCGKYANYKAIAKAGRLAGPRGERLPSGWDRPESSAQTMMKVVRVECITKSASGPSSNRSDAALNWCKIVMELGADITGVCDRFHSLLPASQANTCWLSRNAVRWHPVEEDDDNNADMVTDCSDT